MSDGGKGSAPRKMQDQDAYSKGWDAIFGRNNTQKRQKTDEVYAIMDKQGDFVQNGEQYEKQRCGQTNQSADREQERKDER